MPRVAFEVLEPLVEQLYHRKFDEHDTKGINEHCEEICSFIRNSGWTEDQFIRRMMGFDLPYLN